MLMVGTLLGVIMKHMSLKNPRAILISDIHYNINTLSLADAALKQAVTKANDFEIPLIIAGDLHDTKANIRGECINAIRNTLKSLHRVQRYEKYETAPNCYILRGNHDAINEKSKEHSLNFLEDLAYIIGKPGFSNDLGAINGKSIHLIPYHHDPKELKKYLKTVDKGSCLIMHQGLEGSSAGDYIQDKSAISRDSLSSFTVLSGHYHTRQSVSLPENGMFTYIGNPYTLFYSEATDPEKGFQILYANGSTEFIPTNLRKHIVVDISVNELLEFHHHIDVKEDDLLWVKIRGPKEQLMKHNRNSVSSHLNLLYTNWKLDFIPIDKKVEIFKKSLNMSQFDILDSIIGSLSDTSNERKERLKELWKRKFK